MIRLKEHIQVSKPIQEVFAYVGDFSHIEQWDSGVKSSLKVTTGKMCVGTEYRLKLRYGMFSTEMTYRIIEFDAPRKVVLEGHGDSFRAIDTICFSPVGSSTQIDYQADILFDGFKFKLEPLIKPFLIKVGRQAMAGLKHALTPSNEAPTVKLADMIADKTIVPGMLGFSKIGYYAAQKRFRPNPVNLSEKSIVITGATSGIGLAAAFMLAKTNARLILVSRNRKKAIEVKSRIVSETGNENIGLYDADLSLMADIKKVSDELLQNEPAIDILINNAGALFNDRHVTMEGIESTLATDLLGPFYITNLLIPKLINSTNARIINVSSGGMYTEKIYPEDLEYNSNPYNGAKAYARAKRGLVIATEIWADRLKDKGIVVHAMHPGWVETKGVIESLPTFYKLTRPILRTPDQGADTIFWLASSQEAGRVTGKFWLDRRPHVAHVFPGTRETVQERRIFWQKLHSMTGKTL